LWDEKGAIRQRWPPAARRPAEDATQRTSGLGPCARRARRWVTAGWTASVTSNLATRTMRPSSCIGLMVNGGKRVSRSAMSRCRAPKTPRPCGPMVRTSRSCGRPTTSATGTNLTDELWTVQDHIYRLDVARCLIYERVAVSHELTMALMPRIWASSARLSAPSASAAQSASKAGSKREPLRRPARRCAPRPPPPPPPPPTIQLPPPRPRRRPRDPSGAGSEEEESCRRLAAAAQSGHGGGRGSCSGGVAVARTELGCWQHACRMAPCLPFFPLLIAFVLGLLLLSLFAVFLVVVFGVVVFCFCCCCLLML